MERIYLVGSTARALRRIVRTGMGHGRDLRLEPMGEGIIESFSRRRTSCSALGLDGLRQELALGVDRPLEACVARPAERLRIPGIRFSVRSGALPAASFERLVGASPAGRLLLPSDLEVLVESPGLGLVTAADQLGRLVRSGRMGKGEAQVRLFKLGVEDCSSYALHPLQPARGDSVYELEPVLCATALRDYLSSVRGLPGVGMAREVAKLVYDGSASEMETLLYAALALPLAMGGLALETPAANEEIPLGDMKALALNHLDHITPDLFWRRFGIIIEYLGHEPHEGRDAQDEDMGRIQDYQVLGYYVFPVRYKHVRNATSFNRLALRLAIAMDRRGAKGTQDWVRELTCDPDFCQAQRLLFKVMLPAVQNR